MWSREQMTKDRRQTTERKRGRKLFSVLCLLLSVLCLPACGFQPIYGSHTGANGPVAEQLNQVAIDNIPDRPGQMLRNDLIDRMYGKGRPGQPLYHLSVKLRLAEEDLGILANATSTLAEFNTYADYALSDEHGKELVHGTAHSATSFDRLSNQYATLAAHDSAVERTVGEVSEQIVNRLSLYFANPPPKSEPSKDDIQK
jgi:LPS-assembly lipoprotein